MACIWGEGTSGEVGTTLLEMIRKEARSWKAETNPDRETVGMRNLPGRIELN